MATRRHRLPKPGNRERLKAAVWGALATASRLSADESATTDERIRACHAVASLSGSYARLLDGDGDGGVLQVELVRRIVTSPVEPEGMARDAVSMAPDAVSVDAARIGSALDRDGL